MAKTPKKTPKKTPRKKLKAKVRAKAKLKPVKKVRRRGSRLPLDELQRHYEAIRQELLDVVDGYAGGGNAQENIGGGDAQDMIEQDKNSEPYFLTGEAFTFQRTLKGVSGDEADLVVIFPKSVNIAEEHIYQVRQLEMADDYGGWDTIVVSVASGGQTLDIGRATRNVPNLADTYKPVVRERAGFTIRVRFDQVSDREREFTVAVSGRRITQTSSALTLFQVLDAVSRPSPLRTLWESRSVAHDAWIEAGGCQKCSGFGVVQSGEHIGSTCLCDKSPGTDPMIVLPRLSK